MTATISVFDITKNDSTSTSATAQVAADLDPIDNNDKLLSFRIGNTGYVMKIDATS